MAKLKCWPHVEIQFRIRPLGLTDYLIEFRLYTFCKEINSMFGNQFAVTARDWHSDPNCVRVAFRHAYSQIADRIYQELPCT